MKKGRECKVPAVSCVEASGKVQCDGLRDPQQPVRNVIKYIFFFLLPFTPLLPLQLTVSRGP